MTVGWSIIKKKRCVRLSLIDRQLNWQRVHCYREIIKIFKINQNCLDCLTGHPNSNKLIWMLPGSQYFCSQNYWALTSYYEFSKICYLIYSFTQLTFLIGSFSHLEKFEMKWMSWQIYIEKTRINKLHRIKNIKVSVTFYFLT